MRPLSTTLAVCFFLAAPLARADSFFVEQNKYEGTIRGLREGRLVVNIKGVDRAFDLSQVTVIAVDDAPKFIDAETARIDDAKKAAALYKQLIPSLNNPELKQLAQWRAIEPTDKDGRWLEAVTLFLDVYQGSPTDAVWKGRPAHLPPAASSMLVDSALRVVAAIRNAKSDVARKNLKTLLLEIYTQAGDTQAAQRIAKELATGVAEEAAPASVDSSAVLTGALTEIESVLKAKNYAAAIKQADDLLTAAKAPPADLAVQLFAVKARAYEESEQLELAAAAWLRIPAHYGSSPMAPHALLRAAQIEKRLGHSAASQALVREILDKFSGSNEALVAKTL